MTVYLSSPGSQMHAAALNGMPVLLSFGCWASWLDRYAPSFCQILVDSGAYSAMNSGKVIDPVEYRDWKQRWDGVADACAGLDDIRGDWKTSLRNYEIAGGFPTFHDSDPHELLDELIPLARANGAWLGIGLQPEARAARGPWLHRTLDRVPDDLHVHGFACRHHWLTHGRLDSTDSMNWWLDARKALQVFPHLTPAEAIEIVVKRYQRERRMVSRQHQLDLWRAAGGDAATDDDADGGGA